MLQLTRTVQKSGGQSFVENNASDDDDARERDNRHATKEEPCKANNSVF